MNSKLVAVTLTCIAAGIGLGIVGVEYASTNNVGEEELAAIGFDSLLELDEEAQKAMLAEWKADCGSGSESCTGPVPEELCSMIDSAETFSDPLPCPSGSSLTISEAIQLLAAGIDEPITECMAIDGEARRLMTEMAERASNSELAEEDFGRSLGRKGGGGSSKSTNAYKNLGEGYSWQCSCHTRGWNVFNGYGAHFMTRLDASNSWGGAEQFRHCGSDCLEFHTEGGGKYACNGNYAIPWEKCGCWRSTEYVKVKAKRFVAVYSPTSNMNSCMCTAFQPDAVLDKKGVTPYCGSGQSCPNMGYKAPSYKTCAVGECGAHGGKGNIKFAALVIHDICQAYIGDTADIGSNLAERLSNNWADWNLNGNHCDDDALGIALGGIPGILSALWDGQCDNSNSGDAACPGSINPSAK